MQDNMSEIHPITAIGPVSVADNTAQVGAIIDIQGFNALTYVITTGVIADADATFTVLLEEGNNSALSDAAAVADIDLIGTELLAGFTFTHDNKTRKLGYKGNKRYTRLTITPAANASAALFGAIAVLGESATEPTPNPPA